ncbi:MAG: choice-of-anchor B family protein [Crocinitomicaceae bacterium]
MLKTIALSFLMLFPLGMFGQVELDSLGHLDINSLHNCDLNDIWGYETGANQYAIVGATNGTSIVDVTDPTNPSEVYWEPGINSIWRDIKTWGTHAYVTTEAMGGLTIIDMSPLPASSALSSNVYYGPNGNEWQSSHNIYIDENGYAYIFGANRDNGGVIILDVFTDPMNPAEVGVFDNWYVHDGYVRGDTMYLAHINDGFISMVDVSDKANPVLLGTKTTPSTFSHNIWPSDDGMYAFTTDEVSAAYIGAYDVSDPANIVEVDRIQSSPGAGVIPHNTHFKDDFLITSYYSDGVVVHDVTHPYNMIEVGNFDTYPTQTTSYDGCWGVYPFMSNNIILASDQEYGLFILGSNYTQASYLEGTVTDAVSLAPIDQVEVTISGNNQTEYTSSIGFYATGMALSGTYDVTYFKVGYYPQTVSVTINSGVITTQDIALQPIPTFTLTVNVYDDVTSAPIDNADVRLSATLIDHVGATNALGQEQFDLYYEEIYDVVVGKWGYVTDCFDFDIDQTTGSIDVYLTPGYYDDFSFDNGWTVSGDAQTGMWEWGVPTGNDNNSAPPFDVTDDCGIRCYVTQINTSQSPNNGDIDDGTTTLVSPVMDLTTYTEPYVYYERWFYNNFGPGNVDDTLYIVVSNGIDNVTIDKVGQDIPNFANWVPMLLNISDYITITPFMQFSFVTGDILDPNITEAGLDHFMIIEESAISVEELSTEMLKAYPVPFTNELSIDGLSHDAYFQILDMNGRAVIEGNYTGMLKTDALRPGMYILKAAGQTLKIVKQFN